MDESSYSSVEQIFLLQSFTMDTFEYLRYCGIIFKSTNELSIEKFVRKIYSCEKASDSDTA
jgi:hypothetical protein